MIRPNPHRNIFILLGIPLVSILTIFILIVGSSTRGHCSIEDAPYDKAIALYRIVVKENTNPQEKWEQKIRSLSYINLLVFRAFCALPSITIDETQFTLLRLQEAETQYKAASLVEYFCTQPEADAASAWQLLEILQSTTFVTSSVLGSLPKISLPTAALIFPIIDQIEQLGEAGKWASKALLEVEGISFSGLSAGLAILATLTNGQNWAAERLCQISDMDESTILRGLREMYKLSFGDSWSSRSIFLGPGITSESALFWLTDFFILVEKDQEHSFINFPEEKKTELLAAYAGASEKLIWQINNLHDITDDFGREIGNSRLKKSSFKELRNLYVQLDKTSRKTYQLKMDQAIAARDKNATIRILHLSTERARKESARKLTSSNIYILLAQGNDLYDSSFREILVPILQKRMAASFQNDLLTFLLTTDPGNNYSSNFITNLAHKGKLTHFLPETLIKQKKIIDLVAESAFYDQNSLILFSATFTKLLQLIDPEVRSYLIDIMLNTINRDNSTLSSQLQVILQHYIRRHSEILPVDDRIKISGMIQKRGEIHTEPYTRTPFVEWLRDNVLQSLSVFQRDDDGIGSFFSYCRALIKKGYHPSLSKDYKLTEPTPGQEKELAALLTTVQRQTESNLNLLFRAATKMPIVIDWKKKLNGTEINHSIFVYRDETIQQELIAQFLISGHEMFAQRGHSYWRYEQLIAPFEALWKTEILHSPEIWQKQRFLSIGSCGGIKVYRALNKLFRNQVDILATVGTGKAAINNPYNIALFEIVASSRKSLTWDDVTEKTSAIFSQHQGGEYLQPASLPAILYKMTYTDTDQYDTN